MGWLRRTVTQKARLILYSRKWRDGRARPKKKTSSREQSSGNYLFNAAPTSSMSLSAGSVLSSTAESFPSSPSLSATSFLFWPTSSPTRPRSTGTASISFWSPSWGPLRPLSTIGRSGWWATSWSTTCAFGSLRSCWRCRCGISTGGRTLLARYRQNYQMRPTKSTTWWPVSSRSFVWIRLQWSRECWLLFSIAGRSD